ncbi:hypothetical protein B0H10DRAFT_2236567 [Mycena sp. CBHHK59/15]|nr:hypothetical protein B0H10DRAFT_2236567 [Mycena sp. CBHHK59/15]
MRLKGPLWEFFHKGEKQNSTHYKAYCLGCINSHRPAGAGTSDAIDVDSDSDAESPGPSAEAWFQADILALLNVQAVRGDKPATMASLKATSNAYVPLVISREVAVDGDKLTASFFGDMGQRSSLRCLRPPSAAHPRQNIRFLVLRLYFSLYLLRMQTRSTICLHYIAQNFLTLRIFITVTPNELPPFI